MSGGFETVASEVTHEGIYATVRIDTVAMPDGSSAQREVVEQIPAVGVVPLDGDDVILVRQYRQPFGDEQLEIPAGKLDPGEEPVACAQRELIEEAGLRAGRLTHLIRVRNSAGWTDEVTDVYVGSELTPAVPPASFEPEAEEAHLQVVRMPLAAAIAAVRDGTIVDAKTVIGLLLVGGH